MSLFQRPLRPPAILSDRAVERYLEAVRADLSLDPLFRRRLRGTVVNRFVADREGRIGARPRRRMGFLGRAVLYASFALSISVTSAMAASQGAVPGDALYPLKIQIERLRLQALPEHFHDDLAAHALVERIHELGVLAERQDWGRVTSHAAAVDAEYAGYLHAVERDPGSTSRHVVVLGALLDQLPARAQRTISDVVAGVSTVREKAVPGQGRGSSSGVNPGRGGGSSGGTPGQADGSYEGDGAGSGSGQAREPRETEGPQAAQTKSSKPEPAPTKRPNPEPTPRSSKSPDVPVNPPASPANSNAGR